MDSVKLGGGNQSTFEGSILTPNFRTPLRFVTDPVDLSAGKGMVRPVGT